MDFGIDTVIYIVLGIVFLVAQANRKKKAGSQKVVHETNDVELDELAPRSSVLDEFFGSREEQNIVQKVVEKEYYQDDPPPLSSDLNDADKVFNENSMEKKMEDLPKDENYESAVQNRSSNKLSNFDLRKAVIYSTILERKYF